MKLFDKIKTYFGLPADATEADVNAALDAHGDLANSVKLLGSRFDEFKTEMNAAISAAVKEQVEAIKASIPAQDNEFQTKFSELEAKFKDAESELARLKAEQKPLPGANPEGSDYKPESLQSKLQKEIEETKKKYRG